MNSPIPHSPHTAFAHSSQKEDIHAMQTGLQHQDTNQRQHVHVHIQLPFSSSNHASPFSSTHPSIPSLPEKNATLRNPLQPTSFVPQISTPHHESRHNNPPPRHTATMPPSQRIFLSNIKIGASKEQDAQIILYPLPPTELTTSVFPTAIATSKSR